MLNLTNIRELVMFYDKYDMPGEQLTPCLKSFAITEVASLTICWVLASYSYITQNVTFLGILFGICTYISPAVS